MSGENIRDMSGNKLSDIRNRRIGFVFQTFNLILRTNAMKNVELPMLYTGVPGGKRVTMAKELLELVDMKDRMKHLPSELSGGQKHRVAIARAPHDARDHYRYRFSYSDSAREELTYCINRGCYV